jgi:hypothetical protein
MILLADRNFAAQGLLGEIAATGADLLVRLKNGRTTPVLTRHGDGSYRSMLGALPVRVIEAEITISTTAGRRTGVYRLGTTLLDHHRYPAAELIGALPRTLGDRDRLPGVEIVHPGRSRPARLHPRRGRSRDLRAAGHLPGHPHRHGHAAATATRHRPRPRPRPRQLHHSLHAARDLVIQATGVIADTVVDLAGTIGRYVLAQLMPCRPLRVSRRIVKRAISKYRARGPTSTAPATKPRSPSTSSNPPNLDRPTEDLTPRPWG